MEVNRDLLLRILNTTTCIWTKGFLSCLLDTETPDMATDHAVAKELIEQFLPMSPIEAIKKVSENYGYPLKDAKQMVDTYMATGQIVFPDL